MDEASATPAGPPRLPAGRPFRTRVLTISAALSLTAVVLIALYLTALVQLTPEQWEYFAWVVGVLFVILFPAQDRVQRRIWAPLVRCLDRCTEGTASPDDISSGFAAISNLPFRSFVWSTFWWGLGGVLVAGVMSATFESFGIYSAGITVAASTSGGFVMSVFHYFVMKRILRPVREELAEQVGDPAQRRELVHAIPLARKLLVAITGVVLVTAVFTVLLAQVRAARPIERNAARIQARFLEEVSERLASEGAAALEDARARARRLGISEDLGLLTADGETVVGDTLRLLRDDELRAIREAGLEGGDSTRFDSPNVISWRRMPADGRILVAVSRWELLRGETLEMQNVFALLLLFSTGIAVCLAYLLSSDVSEATEALRSEAERMASGDLRRGRVFESEDELGELARSFEGMARALRATVGRVAEAADRVDGTAGEIASISESVAEVTADQVRGIEQAAVSMEAINGQVQGIAESSQALNVSVEESSSSILELGAAGEELNETALVLSSKVDEVSGSIGQMVRSVKQVLENTEALSRASVETSTSMDEMASSMREVDASAEEAARLSHQVVASAESGQVKVRQTIEGMEAIREATETAERVIRNLGGRAKEIGAIVDVIDDVADETNLLALNAAIIAAQAGEHGRAFSVVADEIKDLADRVLASTKEIGGLVRAVQAESSNAIGAIEQGTQSVASGVDLSAEAGVSLEEITRASRESGTRIAGIVSAVREQARAAGHVVDLMERVRDGVDEIRGAAAEQDRGNESVHQGAVGMREVAQQVRGTTEEQARGSGRIRESVEEVREAVERINGALQEQSAACRAAVEFLEEVSSRTRSHEDSGRRMDEATKGLLRQAEALREDVQRFQI
jgi:methyl-accepting chemotaxis protein